MEELYGNNYLECASLMLRNSESQCNYMPLAQLHFSRNSFSRRLLVGNKTAYYASGNSYWLRHWESNPFTLVVPIRIPLWFVFNNIHLICDSVFQILFWLLKVSSHTGKFHKFCKGSFLLPSWWAKVSRQRHRLGVRDLAQGQALLLMSCHTLWRSVSYLWVWNKITYAVAFCIAINSMYT